MQGIIVPVTPFAQNCSLLWCGETMKGAVVDPGGEIDRIVEAAETKGVEIERILVTHGHADHCGGVAALRRRLGVPVEGPHEDDRFWIDALPEQSSRFGLEHSEAFEPDRWLVEGDTVSFGKVTMQVFHCPGHTPGHIVFFDQAQRLAAVGDVLFAGSIGRTDFPRGNHQDLLDSIQTKLWPLGNDVTFIPGHGPMSTLGQERATNPFVGDAVIGG